MFDYFYNESLRKLVLGVGNLFNNIYVGKFDNGILKEKNRVPLTYSPKEKFIRRIQETSSITPGVRAEITLPRMGFEMIGLNYDPARKLNKLRITSDSPNQETGNHRFNYSEVPYMVNFGLYVFTRDVDENLQIVEQIVSNFTPEFIFQMNFNTLNKKVNVPLVITGTSTNEIYEGDFSERRAVTTTFSFMAKTYVYTRERTGPVITTATDSIFFGGETGAFEGSQKVGGGSWGTSGGTAGLTASYQDFL